MKPYKSLTILSVSLTILLSYNFMSAAWSNPTATAPAANTDAPINVGSTAQTKAGILSLYGLLVEGDTTIASPGPRINFNDTDAGVLDGRLIYTNNILQWQVDRNSDGVWDDDSQPMKLGTGGTSSEDYVQFSNELRADTYCSKNGAVCANIEDLINLLPVSCVVKFSYTYDAVSQANSSKTVTLTAGTESSRKFAIGIGTQRTNNDFGTAPVGLFSNELNREILGSGYYSYNSSSAYSVIGYTIPNMYDTNPSGYDFQEAEFDGHGSTAKIYKSVRMRVGEKVTIDNPAQDGISGDQVHLTAEVLSCTS